MNGGQIESVNRAFYDLEAEVEKITSALRQCATALEDVRSHVRDDSPVMWQRVDRAIEKARELV